MATRFYFQASGSPAVTPVGFHADWEQTGEAVVLPMATAVDVVTALTDSAAITVPITTTQDILCYQFVSARVFLPVRLGSDVTFSMVIRGLESNNAANVRLAYALRAVSVDGQTVLAELASQINNTGTEFTTSAQTRIFSALALTAATLDQPWRPVLEVGGHTQAPASARTYTYRCGTNGASDFALTSGLTTDLNPWMEVSASLNATVLNNYQAVRVPDGLSVAEKIR
jgi:hypothetical protein